MGPSLCSFEGERHDIRGGGARGLSKDMGQSRPHPGVLSTLFCWQHHEPEHGQEEEAGVEEESCRCGNSIGRDGWNHRPYQSMNNAEGLGISEHEEYEGRIKAVLDFQKKSVHCELAGRLFLWCFGHSIWLPLFVRPLSQILRASS